MTGVQANANVFEVAGADDFRQVGRLGHFILKILEQ